MPLDVGTELMLADAYEETYEEALAQGNSAEVAHREGLTAAGMFLASLSGRQDAAARIGLEELSRSWRR